MNNERIAYLLKSYLADNITGTEWQELKELLLQERVSPDLQDALDALIDGSPALPDYEEATWEPLYQRILDGNTTRMGKPSARGRVVSLFKKRGWVAAAILILLATGSWLLFFRQGPGKEMAARTVRLRQQPGNDVAPGSTRAVLTLSDGSTIDLNAAGNGLISRQGNSKLVKLKGGQLAYEATSGSGPSGASHELQANSQATYNTIATPKGGEYRLILPDGSKVWLNAASSLRYPTSFSGKERVVELKGEAYFEVAHLTPKEGQGKMPFRVHVASAAGRGPGMDVQVLGTHFNVMAYADELSINTTLLEGSVKLSNGDRETLIRPGEQAKLKDNGNDFKVTQVDTEEAVAWKNGLFRFNEATVEEVMRQVSRWYDMEVVYVNGAPKDLFRGEIYRNVNVSKVLKVLEASGVHFTVEGKKILVQS
jgi:transmembrane sensor